MKLHIDLLILLFNKVKYSKWVSQLYKKKLQRERIKKKGIYKDYLSKPDIYLLKVNNRNTRTRCEICSKLTIKIPERANDVVLVTLLLI